MKPPKGELAKKSYLQEQNSLKNALFPAIHVGCVQRSQKLCSIYCGAALLWDWYRHYSRNFLRWSLDVVELLKWISPEWIHGELQNKLSTKPQGKHWSSLKPIKLPLGTLHLLSGFQGWVLPWVPLLIDVAILYLCCFIYAYKSLLHFFWWIYPNPGISFA